MKKLSKMLWLCIFSILVVVHSQEESEVPEALQDLQTEFWLPYSVTEDVDFSITRPEGYGCYQWSTDKVDLIRLSPMFSDYELMCGNTLEFQIIPEGPEESVDITITAENAKMGEFDNGIPAVVEYTLHVRPVAKMEVMGLRTELTVGGDPSPFGVAGYDAEENEFDTLDGLQISWYIGAKRNIADFEKYQQKGPISKVIPTGAGAGVVIAVLTDKNYKSLEMATMEITVTSQFSFEPDSVYLLEGAKIHMKVVEVYGKKKKEVTTGGESDEFFLDIKDPEIVALDKAKGDLTALKEGETTIFVKNKEGEILKGQPIWVTTAKRIVITSHPHPESKQLILDQVYDIQVEIFDKDDKLIYPSENILAYTKFPPNMEVLEVHDTMLTAKIKTIATGLGKLKVALRSVLNEEDEEMEIIPHVKMSKDFEVYDPIKLTPPISVMPWDDNIKPTYDLFFKAEGGSKTYLYNVSDPEFGTVDNEGKVTTHTGPGEFKVKAYMPKSPGNFVESKIAILPVFRMEFINSNNEYHTGTEVPLNLRMITYLQDDEDETMYNSCSDIPYEVILSDTENFEYVKRSTRTDHSLGGSCASFTIRIIPAVVDTNLKCDVTAKYFEPSSGRTLRAKTTMKVLNKLKTLHPEPRKGDSGTIRHLHMAVGSSMNVVMRGGPYPWFMEGMDHYTRVITDTDAFAVARNEEASGKKNIEAQTWDDLHVYTVTCLEEGSGMFAVMVGNQITEQTRDQNPMRDHVETEVNCVLPYKLTLLAAAAQDSIAILPKSGKLMSANNKELDILLTVKDKEGYTLDSIESLNFDVKVSDEDLMDVRQNGFVIPRSAFITTTVQGRPYQTVVPKGKDGNVEVTIKLDGYNQSVLDRNGVKQPPSLPKVLDDEDDEEPDEGENYSTTLIDYVTVNLTSMQEIKKLREKNP